MLLALAFRLVHFAFACDSEVAVVASASEKVIYPLHNARGCIVHGSIDCSGDSLHVPLADPLLATTRNTDKPVLVPALFDRQLTTCLSEALRDLCLAVSLAFAVIARLVHHFVPDRRNDFNTGREEGQLCTIPNSSKCQLDVDDRALVIRPFGLPSRFPECSVCHSSRKKYRPGPRTGMVAFLLADQDPFVMSKSSFRVNNLC